jgi:hypothetical protein
MAKKRTPPSRASSSDDISPDWRNNAANQITERLSSYGTSGESATLHRQIDGNGMDDPLGCVTDHAPMIDLRVYIHTIARYMVARFDDATLGGIGSPQMKLNPPEKDRRAMVESCAMQATREYLARIDKLVHSINSWGMELAYCIAAVSDRSLAKLEVELSPNEKGALDEWRRAKPKGKGLKSQSRQCLGPTIDRSRMRAWLISAGYALIEQYTNAVGSSAGRPAGHKDSASAPRRIRISTMERSIERSLVTARNSDLQGAVDRESIEAWNESQTANQSDLARRLAPQFTGMKKDTLKRHIRNALKRIASAEH